MKNGKDYLIAQGWKEGETGTFDLNGLANALDDYAKDLQHHKDTTVGLWATDRPDLIEDPQKMMFQINH